VHPELVRSEPPGQHLVRAPPLAPPVVPLRRRRPRRVGARRGVALVVIMHCSRSLGGGGDGARPSGADSASAGAAAGGAAESVHVHLGADVER